MEPMFKSSLKKSSISSLKKNVEASEPVVLNHDIPPGTKLSFVDIAHSLATIDVESKYNKFSALIDKANEWLKKNYNWKVESCETVSLVFKNEKLDPVDFGATQRQLQPSIKLDLGDCLILKSLRLWISRREDVLEKPEIKRYKDIQTIAFQTFLPQSCKYYEKQIGWEQLDDVVEAINESINCGQINGQLLNIESVNYDANDNWEVDTEMPKQNEFSNKQKTALRVYYVMNTTTEQMIEKVVVFDFIPEIMSANSPPKFEPFSTLLYKVQEFLEDKQEFHFLNLQSLDIKFKKLDQIHTHFMVQINDIGYYLRILRLICIKRPNHIRVKLQRQLPINKTIDPNVMKSESNDSNEDLNHNRDECQELDDFGSRHTIGEHIKPSLLNIESHYFEITPQNTLHGPFYPVKRAIEEFMDRDEWTGSKESQWKYLCAETFIILAKDETDIPKKAEFSLFSNRHGLLLIPRTFYCCRIYFDTSLVFRNTKSKSETFEKEFKLINFKQKSLPETAIQYIDSTAESMASLRNKISKSLFCIIM